MQNFSSFLRLLSLGVALLFATASFGQSTATVFGQVTDQTGAAVAGATITVTNTATSVSQTTKTDASGNYQVPSLLVGTYDVAVNASGLQKLVARGLVLEVSRTTTQNFQLKVAEANEVVTVEGTVPVIDSTTMTVGQTINQRTVQEIPLNGRHFVDLGLLIPGSVTPPANGFLTAPLRGQGSFAFNTAGNREDTVNFMINGVNLNDMAQNQITFQPSINTVSEFKVDNQTYGAQYGRNSGAIVNIATRSGGNQFHGEGFEFVRNNALDARNYFNIKPVRQAQFIRNNFGGNLGGPVIHDKVFFFGSYEGLRQRQGLTLNTQVPSAAQIGQITDPVSKKLAALLPAANDATGTRFIGSASANVEIDQGTGDVYANVTDRTRAHAYYVFQRDHRLEPTLQLNNVPGFGDNRQSHRQVGTFEVDHIFSNSLVSESRVGFNRIHIVFSPNFTANPSSFGINNGITTTVALPQISIGGLSTNFGGPQNFPQGRGDTTGIVSQNVDYLHGNHSFKFGGEFRRFYNNNFTTDPGTLTFNNFADFASGKVDGFSVTLGNQPSRIAIGSLGAYAVDSWKVHRTVTLELGLRYEWNQTPTEAKNRFVNFIDTSDSLVQVSSPYQQSNKNFEPRLGFAWDLFGRGRSVLRSGYGFMVDQPIANLVSGLSANPPFAQPVNFTSSATIPPATYATVLSGAGSSLSPVVVDTHFKNSYTQDYNLNFQQQFARNLGMMVGYFGSKGTHLRERINRNQFINGKRPFPTLSASSPINPNVTLGNISQNVSNGNSNYNALWVSSNLQATAGLQFNASYTWSKSFDYTSQNGQNISSSAATGVQDSFNVRGDYGPSDFDVRNRFVINSIYDLPFKRNRLVGGWEVAGIFQSQGGNPVANIFVGSAAVTGGLTGIVNLRPDLIGPVQIVNQKLAGGTIQYFAPLVCDPASKAGCASGNTFAYPDAGGLHFGNLRRNSIYGPGFTNLDFSLIKRTKITERLSSELRFEAFDVLNHANFGQPGRNALVGSTTFGVITGTRFPTGDSGSSRQLQFAAKLSF